MYEKKLMKQIAGHHRPFPCFAFHMVVMKTSVFILLDGYEKKELRNNKDNATF